MKNAREPAPARPDLEFRPTPAPLPGTTEPIPPSRMNIIERARRFISSVPPAIAGHGGDAATFRAAMVLVKGFGLSQDDALPLFMEWNRRCDPPWSTPELIAKLRSAERNQQPSGTLLDSRPSTPREATTKPPGRRANWPTFRRPTSDETAAIAAARGVSVDSATMIILHNHLWCCRWQSVDCFAIRKGTFAQVRRMDGGKFTLKDGTSIKAMNLPGSEGQFLNPGGLGNPDVPILLTEGAVSLLEVAELIMRADFNSPSSHPIAALAAVSASSRFNPDQLTKLIGRRVRIIPDADPAGRAAAAYWTAVLRHHGCSVDCIALPERCKDLGDALRHVHTADSLWRNLLTL
jgi:hypothetical protein